MSPRISVLLSFYNDERFLAVAIESILDQTFSDFEFLLINDGSTDRSREIAGSFDDPRIRIVDNEANLGLARSLNRGLAMARSEYVARLDGNDQAFSMRLARQVAFLDSHPDVAVVGSQAIVVDTRGRRIRRTEWWNAEVRRPAGGFAMEWYRIFYTPLIHSSVMFRRSIIWDALGGYDDQHPLEMDAELWSRAGSSFRLANIDERLIAWRFDHSSMASDPARRERSGYVTRKTRIIQANMRSVLRWDEAPLELAELWVRSRNYGSTITEGELRSLLDGIDSCAARFAQLHPEASSDKRIARYQASLLANVLWRALPISRGFALSVLATTFRTHHTTALRLLARVAVLFLFGDGAVRFWRYLIRRRPLQMRTNGGLSAERNSLGSRPTDDRKRS